MSQNKKNGAIVGLLTIGQSARDDLFPEIKKSLQPHLIVVEAGVLDGLPEEQIANLAPSAEEEPLITRIKGNKSVVVGKKKIMPFMEQKVDYLEKSGTNLIALLCTAPFRSISSKSLILQPGNLLNALVMALAPDGRIGVFAPLEEQKKAAKQNWQKLGIDAVVENASPYGNLKTLEDAAYRLSSCKDLSLVIMNCLGYTLKMKQLISPFFRVPIILPSSLLARTINALLE